MSPFPSDRALRHAALMRRRAARWSRLPDWFPKPAAVRPWLPEPTTPTPHKETPVSDNTPRPMPTAEQLAYMERLSPLVAGLNKLADEARRNSVEHGFGRHGDRLRRRVEQARADSYVQEEVDEAEEDYRAYLGNRAMLIVGEGVEVHEELRDGRDPLETYYRADGKPEGVGAELADILIRVFDTARELGIDIETRTLEKMTYNAGRPAMHGRTM